MSFVLVVRLTAQDGTEEEAAAVLRELAEATRTEPGCEVYIPVRDPESPRSFVLYEQYVDRAAFEAHGASDHFKRLAAGKLHALLEGERQRDFYETL
jgi:quinol monooxygenase YgiN